jgi:lysophospholipase L1-like esterase
VKEVLCFGDSNTWGYNPVDKTRYPREVRWTGVLQRELGGDFHVIEEGQNARTTVWDDPVSGDKNGLRYLGPCLESHKPLDLVIILLGVNDLKHRFAVTAYDIAQSAGRLVDLARKSDTGPAGGAPEVLLVAPPPLGKLTELAEMFSGGREKSRDLAARFRERAALLGCPFFDAGTVVVSSDIDGVHWAPEHHARLAAALAAETRRLVGG